MTTFVPVSDGVTIAVHDLGGGPGNPEILVMCHATGFCGRTYEPLARVLAQRFHVYAIDFRAHGDSTAPANGNLDWRATADDLRSVIAHVGDGRPVYGFGHSFGGAALVQAEADQPGTLAGAYLFEPIVLPHDESSPLDPTLEAERPLGANMMSIAARRRRRSFASKPEALYRYASRPPLDSMSAGSLAAYVKHAMREESDGTVVLKCSPELEAATFEAPGKPTVATAKMVVMPLTIAVGGDDESLGPAGFARAAAAAMTNATLEQHRFLGHFGPLQAPALIGMRVLEALSR